MKQATRSLLLITLVAGACHRGATPATAPAPKAAPNAPPAGGRGAPPTTPPTTPAPRLPGDTTGAPPGRGNPQTPPPPTTCGAPNGPGGFGGGGEPRPAPYATVIRGDDKVRNGLFKTHRIGTCFYYEIPHNELGKDMILTTEIEKNTLGNGYGGEAVNEEIVRWERRDNRILLRAISYNISASDTTNPIATAVDNANYAPIVRAFPIATWGPDSAPVIDVGAMYTSQIPAEIGLGGAARGAPDASRTFLNSVAAFPTNIEVRSDVTYGAAGGIALPGFPGVGVGRPSSTFLVHWSMVKLPEQPMKPRLFDSRVGYFFERTIDFSRPVQRSEARTFITRYRLECSEQKVGNLCVPKKPIVYYVDPATPKWLVPWVKKAVEDWKPAFEAAGFANAITAQEAPSKAEDPDWSIEDARYSVVDWLPSTIENSVGPSLTDPRSGEILSAHLQIYHNMMNRNKIWYWTQVGALDPRAKKLPFPDSLAGRMMEYVIAHETGHSIGFQHNMKASSLYPADSLHSKDFVHRMGDTPSLMDYARFNYVAQPEDHIALEDLIPRVGPYDIWATHWGYASIPGAQTPDDERATLDLWARDQDTKPYLRFSTAGAGTTDPGDNIEAIGDADPVKSTGYGIRNIKRLVPMLLPATTNAAEDNSELRSMYTELFGQWTTELGHVVGLVGAVESQEKYGSQPGPRFTVESAARQRAAVRFLNENAFPTPAFFLRPEILRRIEPNGALSRVTTAQLRILSALLQDARLNRMIEFEATSHGTTYTAPELLDDVRTGVWSELQAPSVKIDAFRRALQSNYIELMKIKVSPPPGPVLPPGLPLELVQILSQRASSDVRGLARLQLQTLETDVLAAEPRAADTETRAHLNDAHHEIDEILNPRK